MTHPDLVRQLAEEVGDVRQALGPLLLHLQLLTREVTRLRGVVVAFSAVAVTATPDADDPDALALERSTAALAHLLGDQEPVEEPAPSTSSL